MRKAGIRELKNNLSAYIGHVRRGETVQVTDHGQVVAEIVPAGREEFIASLTPVQREIVKTLPPGLIDMAMRGEVKLPTKKKTPLPIMPRVLKEGSAAELLDWTRGER